MLSCTTTLLRLLLLPTRLTYRTSYATPVTEVGIVVCLLEPGTVIVNLATMKLIDPRKIACNLCTIGSRLMKLLLMTRHWTLRMVPPCHVVNVAYALLESRLTKR